MKQYFEVSADWMNKAGRGDVAQAFEVVRIEQDANGPEYDRVVLHTPLGEWPVFRIRGRMVLPYTLIIAHGRFEAATVAKEEPAGAVRVLRAEFNTQAEARIAADELNSALQLVVASDLETLPIELVQKGAIVRRLLRNGLPMLKEWTVGTLDKKDGKYTLIDSKGNVYAMKPGTLVAI
jgi:hypothetical protein